MEPWYHVAFFSSVYYSEYVVYTLGDIFIGNFDKTQAFGARPDIYSARYNLKGHNGIDFGCPSMTPLLSAANGFVYKVGLIGTPTGDPAGYGTYVKLVHQTDDGHYYKTTYAHMNDVAVKIGDRVMQGQLIGHSNNSGFSDGPHLHFGVAPCNSEGVDLEPGNGWSGCIDPNGSLCKWDIKNLTSPVVPGQQEEIQKINIPTSDFTRMVAQGSNYKVIASYLIENGLNQFLISINAPQVDLVNNGQDPVAGEHVTLFLKAVVTKLRTLQEENEKLKNISGQTISPDSVKSAFSQVESAVEQLPDTTKASFFSTFFSGLKNFIFIQK